MTDVLWGQIITAIVTLAGLWITSRRVVAKVDSVHAVVNGNHSEALRKVETLVQEVARLQTSGATTPVGEPSHDEPVTISAGGQVRIAEGVRRVTDDPPSPPPDTEWQPASTTPPPKKKKKP